MTQKMTLTRALSEVATLEKRIPASITATTFVSTKKGVTKEQPVDRKYKDVQEVVETIKSQVSSTEDLIARRAKIKAAIAKANVSTIVSIAGVEMSIAEALDYRKTIEYKSQIVATARNQLHIAAQAIDKNQREMDTQIQATIQQVMGKDAGTDRNAVERVQEVMQKAVDTIKDQNTVSLIDPIDVKNMIETISKEVADALNEIDFALSEINAQTFIEV